MGKLSGMCKKRILGSRKEKELAGDKTECYTDRNQAVLEKQNFTYENNLITENFDDV